MCLKTIARPFAFSVVISVVLVIFYIQSVATITNYNHQCMTTVKVKFRPSAVAGRPGSIVYLITHRQVTRQFTSGFKVFPHEWDDEHSKPVFIPGNERTDLIRSIDAGILRDVEQLDRIIGKWEGRRLAYSPDDVLTEFRRTGRGNTLFIFMEDIILRLQHLNHFGTACNYRAAINSFKRFRNNEDIPLETIDHVVMEDYQAYLALSGLTPNSTSFYMRILRAVYNRAVEQELTADRKPFRTVFTGIEKTAKRAISLNDIRRIRNLELACHPALEMARDLFLFLFFCRGMSFIDAVFLKKTDIQNGVLTYRRHKTGQLLHVKVIPPIRELIEKYSSGNSPYLLPFITHPGADGRKQYETALRRVNKALKLVARMIKLPVPLTTYVSRHAWASIAKSKNIPVNVISDALGHDSIATTQIYLASIDASTIDRANDLIIKGL